MKKSKFLKKSLATLLALMLVVAMIPMSASAVAAGDGVISIEAETGTLTGSGTSFTDTVPWAAADQKETKLTIVPDASKGFDRIVWNKVSDRDTTTTATVSNDVVVLTEQKEDIEFYATNADASKKSAVFTVKIVLTPASNDTSIKEAKIGEVKGVVDNSKKTITFDSLPWSVSGATSVSITMNYPVSSVPVAGSVTVTDGEGTGSVVVAAQTGSTETYTIEAKHSEGLISLSIGGVAAVKGEDGKYTVSLPVGTDTKEPLSVEFTSGTKLSKATFDGKEIESGKSYDLSNAIGSEKELALTAEAGGTKDYKVTVDVAKSDDTAISAFTATAGGFTESGVIDGKNLTVELPYGKDIAKSVELAFTVPTGAVASVVGDDDLTVNLEKPVTVKVVAADGETIAYYTLTATVAKNPNSDPKINSAKVTVNEVEYTAVPNSKNEIIFTVPYSTKEADVTGVDKYIFSKTARTKLDATALDSITVSTSKEITVTSEAGDKLTYTVSFVKAEAETGKELSKFTFTSAAKEEDVTSSNTYPVALDATKKTATVTLPYSYKANTADISLIPQFTLSKGAKLYQNASANVGAALVSGFENATPITDTVLEAGAKLIVADETAAFAIDNAAGATTIAGLNSSNTVVYDVKVEYAPAATGHTLNSFSVKNGITSKISGNTITITIPYTESIAPQIGHAFYADYSASDRAVVTAEGAELPATYDNTPNEGRLWYWNSTTTGRSDLRLEVSDKAGTTWTEVESIVVTNEAGTASTKYAVTVEVAPAETGAAITAAKVGTVNGTIQGKTISATLPYGADPTAVKLNLTASKMAKVEVGTTAYVEDMEIDVSEPVAITVTSEDTKTKNVYTLKVTVADKFVDVPENAWYYDYVMAAAKAGIVNGKENSRFDPEGNVTRRDFALMLTRMLGVDVSGYTTTPFEDVKADDYGLGAIAYCAENGIVGGDGKGNFLPDSSITREEAAKMIAVAKELKGTTTEKFKDDAKISSWAKVYVDACKAAGIFGGDEKGNFNPKSPITRAETAKIMVVAMNLK